jgi:hypothetical protein
MMFPLEVTVEAPDFLPFDDGECCVERIEIGDLNIGRVKVVLVIVASERNPPLVNMIALRRRAGRDPQDATEGAVDQFKTHADVDKGNVSGLEPLDDTSLGLAAIEAQKDKRRAFEQVKVLRTDIDRMRNDSAVHAGIDCLVIVDLLRHTAQFIERGRSRRTKGVVLQKFVPIDETDFARQRLGDQIQDIRSSAAETDDHELLAYEALRQGAHARAV